MFAAAPGPGGPGGPEVEEVVLVAGQEEQVAALAAVAGLLLPEVIAGPDWLVAEVAAGVAVDLLSLLLAWPPLLVLVLLQLAVWLLWLLLWLQCQWLSWLLLLLVQLMLHAAGNLSLCLIVIRYRPYCS